jgi:metallo-beta-lactamase class B
MLMIRKLLLGLTCFCTVINAFAQSKNRDILLTRLCDRFYVHTTWMPDKAGSIPANGLIAETDHGVILIDTGWDTAQTRALLQQVQTKLHKPVLLCIISHCHIDRLGGCRAAGATY